MGQSPNFNKRQRSSESRRCTTTTDSNMQEAKVAVEPSRVHVDGNARRPAGRGGTVRQLGAACSPDGRAESKPAAQRLLHQFPTAPSLSALN